MKPRQKDQSRLVTNRLRPGLVKTSLETAKRPRPTTEDRSLVVWSSLLWFLDLRGLVLVSVQACRGKRPPLAEGGPSDDLNLQDNLYAAIGGLPTAVMPATQARKMGAVAYEGLKTVFQGLYDCSDLLLPLKAALGALLTISKIVDVHGLMLCSWIIHDYYCAPEGFRK